MPWCVVIGCRNNLKATRRAGKGVSYHIFPKNPQRRNAWIKILNRPFKLNADSSYVCSEHFTPDDFECNSLKEELLNIKVKKQLKKTAIPSINLSKPPEEDQLEVSAIILNGRNEDEIHTSNKVTDRNLLDLQQYCAVPGCKNINDKSGQTTNKNILFHNFPNDTEMLNKWLEFCNCSKEFQFAHKNALICSEHFDKDNYYYRYITEPMQTLKLLKNDAVPTLNGDFKIVGKKIEDELYKKERKKFVDKLLADYEELQKSNDHSNKGYGIKSMVSKYPNFFTPIINPNAKLGDKLKLLKSIINEDNCTLPKKRKISISESLDNTSSENVQLPLLNKNHQIKDQVIQVSAVQGGLMLYAIPQTATATSSSLSEKDGTDEEEVIIVTGDEASCTDLSSYEEQYKENNTEIIIVTNLKETEDSLKHAEGVSDKSSTKIVENCNKSRVQNLLENNSRPPTPLYSDKVLPCESKGCQVSITCKGCEQRSLKINKLLRERTRLLKDQNQNGAWKDPDEINTLKRINGVLSLLLMQCVGEKNGKKPTSVRVDLVQDSIERVNRGWSMQDTSETLCQALSANAYDEFARTFEIINEI